MARDEIRRGFVRRTGVRCEDCDLRGDLNMLGTPKLQRRVMTRDRDHWDGSINIGWGACEACAGRAYMPLVGIDQIDPYARKT